MRVTGHRFAVLLLASACLLRAGARQDIVDTFARITSALVEEQPNASGFLKSFDKSMPGYLELERNIKALLADWVPASSIDFLQDEGDDSKRDVELDWFLELRSRQDGGPTRSRRETIHCQLVKQGKSWRIVSMQPQTIFKP